MRARLQRAVRRTFSPTTTRGRRRGEGLVNGIELVLPTVLFTLLGVWIDSRLGTAPLFTIALFLFGAAGTFASAYYRYRARSEALDQGKPWARGSSPS